jgi:hypothetical protein
MLSWEDCASWDSMSKFEKQYEPDEKRTENQGGLKAVLPNGRDPETIANCWMRDVDPSEDACKRAETVVRKRVEAELYGIFSRLRPIGVVVDFVWVRSRIIFISSGTTTTAEASTSRSRYVRLRTAG